MEIDAELIGVEETFDNMARFLAVQEKAIEEVLEWILRAMVNYVKTHGPWEDRTANLRNSISANYDAMKEWPADTDPDTLKSKVTQLEKPVLHIHGDDYEAVLSAGMEYAIWVETTSGYWVLQGAIDKFEPLIDKYFAGYLAVEKLDLEHVASIAYMQQFGGE